MHLGQYLQEVDMGKGSRARPFSVSQEEFANSFEKIFGKKNMQVRVKEDVKDIGKCGCGRSPTGKCIGWHGLNEEQLVEAKRKWELDEYTKQAQGLWSDSCTSNRSK
jgi:hypothetical protein